MTMARPWGFVRPGAWDDAFSDIQQENLDQQRNALEDLGSEDYRPYGNLQDVLDSFLPRDWLQGITQGPQEGMTGDTGAYAGFAAPAPQEEPPDNGILARIGRGLAGGNPFETHRAAPAARGSLGNLALTPFDVQRAYNTANVDIPGYTPFVRNTVQPAVADVVNAPFQAAGLDTELPGQLASGIVPAGAADVAMTLGPLAPRVAEHYSFPPEVPQTLYHWTPDANVGSIAENGLNPGSWLARTPEEAQNLARIPNRITGALGLPPVSSGQVFEVPGEGALPTRTTLTREPAYRSGNVLPATPVEMPAPKPNAFGQLLAGEGGYVRFNGNPEPTNEPLSIFQKRPEARVNAAGEVEVQQPGRAFERQVPEAAAPQGQPVARLGKVANGWISPEGQTLELPYGRDHAASVGGQQNIDARVRTGWDRVRTSGSSLYVDTSNPNQVRNLANQYAEQLGPNGRIFYDVRDPETGIVSHGEKNLQDVLLEGATTPRITTPTSQYTPSDIEDLKAQLRQAVTPEGIAAMKAEEEDIARQQAIRAAQTMGGQQGGLTTDLHRKLQASIDALKRGVTEEGGGGSPEELLGFGQRVLNETLGTAGSLTSIKSSLTPPFLRQGWTRFVSNPKAAFSELGQSLKAGLNEETAQAYQDAILKDPWVRDTSGATISPSAPFSDLVKGLQGGKTMATGVDNAGYTWQDLGGTVLKWGKDAEADLRPEELANLRRSWLGRKYEESRAGQFSDRQAAVQLNMNRTNWYSDVASAMWKAGERDKEDYKRLVDFIEHATQRGSWGQSRIPAFFSQRAMSGRIQFVKDLLTEIPRGIATGDILHPGASQEAAKTLIGMAAAGTAMVYIPAQLGLGRVTFNDGLPVLDLGTGQHHRIFDPWAGWNTLAKLTVGVGKDVNARLHGRMKDEHGNVKSNLATQDIPQDVGKLAWNRALQFARKGLGPAMGEVVNVGTGKDFTGKPYNLANDVKSGNLATDMVAPFLISDLYDAYREGGPVAVAERAPASFFSLGGSDYTEDGKKISRGKGFNPFAAPGSRPVAPGAGWNPFK